MTVKSRNLLVIFGCVLGLAVIEQAGAANGYYSKTLSTSGTDIVRKPAAADLVSTLRVERPATRWLPFVKFGETVHVRTYQDRAANGTIFEKTVTTRTKLFVAGLCSTARYDDLANGLYEKAQKYHLGLRLATGP